MQRSVEMRRGNEKKREEEGGETIKGKLLTNTWWHRVGCRVSFSFSFSRKQLLLYLLIPDHIRTWSTFNLRPIITFLHRSPPFSHFFTPPPGLKVGLLRTYDPKIRGHNLSTAGSFFLKVEPGSKLFLDAFDSDGQSEKGQRLGKRIYILTV